MTTDNATEVYQQILENKGIMMFDFTGHSIFAATHKIMYRYLPISAENAAKVNMFGANAIYIYRTREIYENIIYWWVLCALTKDCMAPTSDLYCNLQGRNVYAHCHRYDQSAINIIAANYFQYNETKYFTKVGIMEVKRYSQHKEELWTCNTKRNRTKVHTAKFI